MKKKEIFPLLLLIISILVSRYDYAETAPSKYKEGELIVKFKLPVSEDTKKNIHEKHQAKKIKDLPLLRIHHVKLKEGLNVQDAIERYKADIEVEYAEPNYIVENQSFPNDPEFNALWSLHNTGQSGGRPYSDMSALRAWDFTIGDSNVVIAIIDTGVDYLHEELAANMWINETEYYGSPGVDDDGNGYVDDIYGIDASNNDSDPMDDNGHGTHVSGIIGATGNNNIGVVGVNWDVKMMACKSLNADGYGYLDGILECLEYVRAMRERNVNVIAVNGTWGCSGNGCYSQALYDAINEQKEVLFITAAGNGNADNDMSTVIPATYDLPNIIAVAATDHNDGLAAFSNYGRHTVHVGAPGVNILSAFPQDNYALWSGTSMAASHVTGLAALIKSQDSRRNWIQIKNLILSGGDSITSMAGKTITGKRLNAYGSLACMDNPVFSVLKYPATIEIGAPAVLSALSINCDAAVGPVTVTTSDGETIELSDNGINPDLAAGDGIFSVLWTPKRTTNQLTFFSPIAGSEIVMPVTTANDTPSDKKGGGGNTQNDQGKGMSDANNGKAKEDSGKSGVQSGKKTGIAGPGWFMGKAEPVSHEEAEAYYASKRDELKKASQESIVVPFASSATDVTSEISELARALRYDPKLIYDYVHNYIDYVPYFGSLKGATLTYLDGSGNDFDQASLMIALLRASSTYNPSIGTVQYVYGQMNIPYADLSNWLGVDNNSTIIVTVIASGGIPVTKYSTYAKVNRVWVKANIEGTDYLFDPAFKSYTYTSKIDLGAAMGYAQSQLLTAAGGTIGDNGYSIRNMDETNLRNQLATYSTNLVNTIRSQYPNSDVKDIIGGRSIVQTNLTQYSTSLPFSPTPLDIPWDEILNEYTAKLIIRHGDVSRKNYFCKIINPDLTSVDINWDSYIPGIAEKRFTLTHTGNVPQIYLDGTLIAQGNATTVDKAFCIVVDHPYAKNSGNYADQFSPYTVITLPQRGRLDGCEPSQRRPFRFILKSALFLFTVQLFLISNVVFDL
ncbi:MAG: S8 family serine peptidase, partial [Nitrospirae bacterium]|nr:S8 family serine peptidase [Nitrospirota bacterium]